MTIDWQSQITIQEMAVWMDGGTVTVNCSNEKGESFEVEFVQYMNPSYPDKKAIPGRIYLNHDLVTVRSELETEILEAFDRADFKQVNHSNRSILSECLAFVRSDFYLDFANKVIFKPVDPDPR